MENEENKAPYISLVLIVAFILLLIATSCSKTEECDCTVITIETTNYVVSKCSVEDTSEFERYGSHKQARTIEAKDNCYGYTN